MKNRVKCQRVTRCCGYFRPIDNMNEGKQQEVEDRLMFNIENDKKENNKKT